MQQTRSTCIAIDRFGQVIDLYASARRDTEAARRFFHRARTTTGVAPASRCFADAYGGDKEANVEDYR